MSLILAIVTAAFFLAADQITKHIVITNMELGQSIDFIDGLLDFTYIHNDGGAWGMFGGYRAMLLGVTAVMMVVILVLLIKNGKKSIKINNIQIKKDDTLLYHPSDII